ncbi:MAG TPA: DUF4233 domain-containing protein [Brevibacterium senegalense]|uniref:DUF4233 domain-containing protein n=1 Tax=Brevibacterium senegalense TaxID=1033736 RepID=A0A921ME55_9MICO|nr:DUF4233 domain-containing protein [Brevibacterium senegalense]
MTAQAKSKLPILAGVVLVCEVLVLYFAGLMGIGLRPAFISMGVYIGLLTATALLLIAAAVLLPRRRFQNRPGIMLGWIGQVAILALGIVSPGLIFVALVFGTMWGVGVYWGRRIDREAAAREA